jgi:hypothetical protein
MPTRGPVVPDYHSFPSRRVKSNDPTKKCRAPRRRRPTRASRGHGHYQRRVSAYRLVSRGDCRREDCRPGRQRAGRSGWHVADVVQRIDARWRLEGAAPRPCACVRNYFSTILDYSASMVTRPDDSKKTPVRALQRRHTLLAAWLDVLDQLDGPGRQRPEVPARSTIPSSRQPRSARTRRRLAPYSQEGHVAALTAKRRRTAPL